jgi:hypothetical protein
MSGTVAAVIAGSVTLIIVYLVLTMSTNRGTNAFTDIVNAMGGQYTTIIKTFMGAKTS